MALVHLHASALTGRPGPAVGSADDFQALFLEHYGFVRRCTRRFGVPEAHADDAAQEVFLVAHRRRDDFDRSAPRAFLRGVAWRVCANVRRRLNNREKHAASLPVDAVESPNRSDHSVSKKERAKVVRRCLADMDPARAEAFQLLVVEGLHASEVAKALDTSTHAIYRHVRAAKVALSAAIAEHQKGEVAS